MKQSCLSPLAVGQAVPELSLEVAKLSLDLTKLHLEVTKLSLDLTKLHLGVTKLSLDLTKLHLEVFAIGSVPDGKGLFNKLCV